MKRAAILAAVIAAIAGGVVACSSEPTPAAPSLGTPAGAATAAPPAVMIAGEWRVAGVDGKPFERPYGLALSATSGHIWWEPGCAGQGRRFTISGTAFRADRPSPPGEVCDIAVPPELEQIWDVLVVADTIARTPQNGVLIEGGGRSVLLFSQ